MIPELANQIRLSTLARIETYTKSYNAIECIDSEAAHTYITRTRQLLDEIETTIIYCPECNSHLLSGDSVTGYACDDCGHDWSA